MKTYACVIKTIEPNRKNGIFRRLPTCLNQYESEAFQYLSPNNIETIEFYVGILQITLNQMNVISIGTIDL